MKCPNCGAEMKEGTLYCEHCGEDIHIVPDFEPEIEYNMEQTLHDIAREMTPEEDATDDQDAHCRTGMKNRWKIRQNIPFAGNSLC